MKQISKGETVLINEGSIDGLCEDGYISFNKAEEIGHYEQTCTNCQQVSDTTIYKVEFLKDWQE